MKFLHFALLALATIGFEASGQLVLDASRTAGKDAKPHLISHPMEWGKTTNPFKARGSQAPYKAGAVTPPVTWDLNDIGDVVPEGFTIVDANNDGTYWFAASDHFSISYNPDNQADDYIILPGVELTAGQTYLFSLDAAVLSPEYPEAFEVVVGKAAEVEQLTTKVIEPVTITNDSYQPYSGAYSPAESGTYYFAVHGLSQPNMYYLNVDNFSVIGPISASTPSAPTMLTATVTESTTPQALVTLKAPTTTVLGEPLSSLTSISVTLEGTVKHVFTSPEPGAELEHLIDLDEFGYYNFGAYATVGEDNSPTVGVEAFIGHNRPLTPYYINIEPLDDGAYKLSWMAVDMDYTYQPIDPATVKYTIFNGLDGTIVADDIEGTEYVFTPSGDKQVAYVFELFSKNAGGYSMSSVKTDPVLTGPAYDLPYVQSFADGGIGGLVWYFRSINGGDWAVTDDSLFTNLKSQDNDNGFCYMVVWNGYGYGDLLTGRMNITGEAPAFSFYYYAVANDNTNKVMIYAIEDGQTPDSGTLLATFDQAGNAEWLLAKVDLSAYIGKTIQLMIRGEVNYYSFIELDNMRVDENRSSNVALPRLIAPAEATVNTDVEVPVVVRNDAPVKADNVEVTLLRDGVVLETKNVTGLEPCSVNNITFTDHLNAAQEGEHVYTATISYAGDDDATDNASHEVTTVYKGSYLPGPEISYDGTNIVWTLPAVGENAVAEQVKETFDNPEYPHLTTKSFGQWTLENYNDNPTYSWLDGQEIPGAWEESIGWILFNDKETIELYMNQLDRPAIAAPSHRSGANDAWLISPLLSGEEQTIRFIAAAADPYYTK